MVLAASIWLNQFLAVRLAAAPVERRKVLPTAGIVLNLLGIAYYKYLTFFWGFTNDAAAAIGWGA